VGSLFGLNPYSSISFLRSSSEFFRAFRLLQNQIPSTMSIATTTTGTTTAIATFPPLDRPLDPFLEALAVFDVRAAVDEELDEVEDLDEVVGRKDWEVTGAVDVMKIVVGAVLPFAADSVTIEETITTEDVSGSVEVVGVTSGVVDTGNVKEVVSGKELEVEIKDELLVIGAVIFKKDLRKRSLVMVFTGQKDAYL
jgi:hypothetical protein